MLDCENFIIENCDINTHDDGICLKGYSEAGVRNGIIRNNRVRSICNGIKMGTDSSGGFRDIRIENNEVWQTGISGIALEMTDGGVLENVIVRNITMDVVATPVFIMLSNRNRSLYGQLTVPNGVIRNVYIGDIRATVDKYETYHEAERKHFDFIPYASSITGFPDNYIEDVIVENVDITIRGGFPVRTAEDALREIPEAGRKYPENRMFGVLPAYGFYVRHVRNLNMKNISLAIEQEDSRPAFLLDDVHNSKFTDIMVQGIKPTPAFSVYPNCSENQLDLERI
jgi:polygalacturonase